MLGILEISNHGEATAAQVRVGRHQAIELRRGSFPVQSGSTARRAGPDQDEAEHE